MRPESLTHIKKLVFRGFIFLLVFIALDFAVGTVVRFGYFSQEDKNTYGVLKTKDDIIVVGSSRANSHYVPSVFTDALGLSCFNMGSGGQNIYYYYGIIGSIMERYNPKFIIMDVMSSDIEFREGDTDRMSDFMPLYRTSKSIKEMVDLRGPEEKVKHLSRVYPFNSQVSSILYSYLKKGHNPHLVMNGYIPLDGRISGAVPVVERNTEGVLNSRKMELVEKIAAQCQKANVQLLVIISPRYTSFKTPNAAIDTLNCIVTRYGAEVWDYEQDPYFLAHGDLFRDELHLNHKGAVEYSGIIADRIKRSFIEKE